MGAVLIEFRQELGGPVPVDPSLYSLAVQYCQENLEEMPDLKRFAKSYLAVEFGDKGQVVAVHGITCFRYVPDVSVFRATGPYVKRATNDLYERLNAHLADAGWRGQEAFVRVNSKESAEQRCESWEETLKDVEAKPAERFAVIVR